MTEAEIQRRADMLSDAMLAKGMRAPKATVMIRSMQDTCVHMAWADTSQTYGESYDTFTGDGVGEAFELAEAFVANRPTPEQARLNEFMASLGKVIDFGKTAGIEVEFLNPLVRTMKKLSENIITHEAA